MLLLAALVLVAAPPARVPVLVELFTSEGCSSCPPADLLLQRLRREQPVPGVEVVTLSEHVDYWDHLGFRDPFSSASASERQRDYSASVSQGRVYTPQAVIAGHLDATGGSGKQVTDALLAAAQDPRGVVKLERREPAEAGRVRIEVSGLPPHGEATLWLARVEDELESRVGAGENAGRTLHHDAVVRSLEKVATLGAGAAGTSVEVAGPARDARKRRLVAFVQDRGSLRILAVAAQ